MRNNGYLDNLTTQLNRVIDCDKKIVLFGTLEMSMMIQRTLAFYNKSIYCFLDNDPEKRKTIINDLKVYSPEELLDEGTAFQIIICTYNRSNMKQIKEQLMAMGFDDVYESDPFFFAYQAYVMKRPVDHEAYARTIEMLNDPADKIIIGQGEANVPVIITEKCTLSCKDCGVMIPYYHQPMHYDKEFILKSIRTLAQCVDAIETINLIGGETLLHPDLGEICQEVAKIDNIYSIIIATNGTIIPDDETIKKLSGSVTKVILSDYGDLSRNKAGLKEKLDSNGIFYVSFCDDVLWTKFYPPQKYNRTQEENAEIFEHCKWAKLLSKMINGEFHLCDFSAGLSKFKMIPNNQSDYVNLMDDSLTIGEKRALMMELLNRRPYLEACDYCVLYKGETTDRAIQSKAKLNF